MTLEQPVCIESGGRRLIGVLHQSTDRAATPAVVVVVGGPQYRVGSHRQFVLLARALCARGTPVLRFDFPGMGDSGGEFEGFEHVDRDIRVAIDEIQARDPTPHGICLWGLCDGASAALMYAIQDPRVTHLVLLNPWVRTSAGQAQAYLDAYYGRRLRSRGFWARMFGNPVALLRGASGYVANLRGARRTSSAGAELDYAPGHFLARMLSGAQGFTGRTLVLLSGQDLVATEFESMLARSEHWRAAFDSSRVQTRKLLPATHTFSRRAWRDWAAQATAEFIAG
jgi:exosortase A-associated hydrolase 1